VAKIIVVREERCLGCHSCMLACGLAHSAAGSLAEAVRAKTPPQSRVHVEPVGSFGMPLQCRHCEDAPCMAVCPTRAIYRHAPGEPVLLDGERCIGCKFCIQVCPFGVIDLSRDGKAMIKCDLCAERTAAGEAPACVAACPTGALVFEDVERFLRDRRRGAGARAASAGPAAPEADVR
jgi:carbon-monoxide dehydrogenase iron sulfur subunit